jgi:hypothetical protein
MANIRLSKTVFKKDELEKAIDSSFKTFVDIVEEDNDTVEELFRLYNKLFYEIPAEGAENSHEYLIRESSKMVELEKEDLEVQPLLDEISDLRERLLQQNINSLDTQNEIIKTITNTSSNSTAENEKIIDNVRKNIDKASNERVEAPAPKPSTQQVIAGRKYRPFGKPGLRPNEVKKYEGKAYRWNRNQQQWDRLFPG